MQRESETHRRAYSLLVMHKNRAPVIREVLMVLLSVKYVNFAPAFARLPRTTTAVAVVSAALLILATAVDVQPPRRARNPLRDYVWPLWRDKPVRLYENVEIRGPVSANPIGVYEGGYYRLFGPTSRVATWNSYNVGEILWPQSRLSLVPLALWLGAGLFVTLAWSRADRAAGEEPPLSRP